MNKRKLLGIAVSSILLGSFANTASSFTYDFTTSTTVSPAKFAAELPSSQTSLSIPSFKVVIPTPATDVTGAAPFYINFTLKGATKFTTTPIVKCWASGAALSQVEMNLQLGAGTNNLVYQLNAPSVSPNKYRLKSTGTCTMTAGVGAGAQPAQLNMTSLTSASMSAKIEYRGDRKSVV